MKKHKVQLFVWAFLTALILLALPSFTQNGTKLIGKSFVDTDDFDREMNVFYERIGPTVLNPIDEEEAKKEIPVSSDEIEEYRNRYGELPDQISDIHEQYENRIVEAKDSGNKVLEDTLVKERDTKIADIQKNFESTTHVEAKISAQKAVAIDRYLEGIISSDVGNLPIAYKFIDVETGEAYSSGDIDGPTAYKKQFNSNEGLFKASSIPSNDYNSGWSDSVASSSDSAVELLDGDLSFLKASVRTFEGVVVVPKTALKDGFLGNLVMDYNKMKYTSYTLWILAALSAVALFTVLRFRKEWVTEAELSVRYDQLKIDMKAALLLFSAVVATRYFSTFGYNIIYSLLPQHGPVWWIWVVQFLFLTIAVAFITFQLVNMVERWRQKGIMEQDIKESYTASFFEAVANMFLNKKIGTQMFILLIGFFLAGVGFAAALMQPVLIIVYFPAVLFLGLPAIYIFVRRSAYLNRIIVATEEMAAGRLQKEIVIEGKSPLAKHAKNLNNLREGVRSSMSEQAKSERMKTELITNVSHDLRTPLTSIITYTDLLKNEELSVDDRAKYVEIIDKKSQRLKTLIEDLFEVSKMASGNLELNKQRVDLTQLLQQALAEHEEEITETGLDFRVSLPESPLVAHIDGKRWWRVLDNLIVNAIKYTMPGTRVYITLRKIEDSAEFVVKNITKYELGENTDELFERFKRADTSRHTEGSGLGLAIAQSIVDMHGGEMKIEVDGDLFKVTVVVPIIY